MLIKTLIEEARAIIGAVGDLQAFFAEGREKQAAALSGKWTNEGAIGEFPSHYLHLELRVEGSEVSGIVESRALSSSGAILPNVSIIGQLRWGRIVGEVHDVSQGRVLTYGLVIIRLRKGKLDWQLKRGVADFLPQSAVLWRSRAAEVSEEALRQLRL